MNLIFYKERKINQYDQKHDMTENSVEREYGKSICKYKYLLLKGSLEMQVSFLGSVLVEEEGGVLTEREREKEKF